MRLRTRRDPEAVAALMCKAKPADNAKLFLFSAARCLLQGHEHDACELRVPATSTQEIT